MSVAGIEDQIIDVIQYAHAACACPGNQTTDHLIIPRAADDQHVRAIEEIETLGEVGASEPGSGDAAPGLRAQRFYHIVDTISEGAGVRAFVYVGNAAIARAEHPHAFF